jgi:hypothetical protein
MCSHSYATHRVRSIATGVSAVQAGGRKPFGANVSRAPNDNVTHGTVCPNWERSLLVRARVRCTVLPRRRRDGDAPFGVRCTGLDADARRTGAGPLFRAGKKFPMADGLAEKQAPVQLSQLVFTPLPRHTRLRCDATAEDQWGTGRSDCRAHAWTLAVRQVAGPGWSLGSRPYLLAMRCCWLPCQLPRGRGPGGMPARSGSFEGRTGRLLRHL